MDLQADIDWIKSELAEVTDVNLIEAFKHLLAYRKSKADTATSFFSTTKEEMQQRAEASLKSVEQGNTRNITEFKTEVENWKTRPTI
ncbi:MAG: hypothetical protein JKY53_10895 [Flavobacteriales bacterium]|nr:hypothetical protein [Flavobacteriales bacterium]